MPSTKSSKRNLRKKLARSANLNVDTAEETLDVDTELSPGERFDIYYDPKNLSKSDIFIGREVY